jgi:tetratricopeptide (TPR) repeat protein
MPNVPETLFEMARTEERFGFDEKAIETYQRGLAISPNRPDIHLDLGFLLSQRDEFTDAFAAYNTALTLDSKIAGARTRIGMIHFQEGKHDEAIREYELEITNGSADFLTYYNLGQALLKKKRFDAAVKAFEQCLEREPNDQNGLYGISQAFRGLKKTAEAKQFLDKYQALRKQELKAKEARGPGTPRNGELRNAAETCSSVADIYLAIGKTDDGIRALEAALVFNPRDYRAAAKLVDTLRQNKKIREGIEIGLRYAEKQPGNIELAYLLGGMCSVTQQYREAAAMLQRVVERDPENMTANRTLAFAILRAQLFGRESGARALVHSTKAVEKERSWENLDVHAYALFSAERPVEAAEAMEGAIKLLHKKIAEAPEDQRLRSRLDKLVARLATITRPEDGG